MTVHIVGSVPLADSEQVLYALAAVGDGAAVHRFPDGETGARKDWIVWQGDVFAACDAFVHVQDTKDYGQQQFFGLSESARADGFVIPRLGYAAVAIHSFGTFARLRDEGTIPPDARFQVSLPTPTAVVAAFIAPGDRALVEPAYADALARARGGRPRVPPPLRRRRPRSLSGARRHRADGVDRHQDGAGERLRRGIYQ